MNAVPHPGGATRRLVLVLGLLVASAVLLVPRNATLAAVFGLSFVGVLGGAVLGILPRPHLAVIGAGVAAIAWALVLVPSPSPWLASTLAHLAAGALLAWVLAGPARHRWPWMAAPRFTASWFALPALVLAAGGVWELGELAVDGVFDTDLSIDTTDTLMDLVADFSGAVAALARRDRPLSPRRT